MSKIKAMKKWQKLLIGFAVMALAGALTFMLVANVFPPQLYSVTIDVNENNLTKNAAKELELENGSPATSLINMQFRTVRAGVFRSGRTFEEVMASVFGADAAIVKEEFQLLYDKLKLTATTPMSITISAETMDRLSDAEVAKSFLKAIAEEGSANINWQAAKDFADLEHPDNVIGEVTQVPNLSARVYIWTAVVALLAGAVVYMLLTSDAPSLAFRKLLAYTVLVLLTVLCIVFFYIMFINSSRAHGDIQSRFSLVPGAAFGKNWQTLMSNAELPVWRGMFNSLVIAGCSALLSTYFSVLTAYAIHAYQFRLRNFAFKFILLVMMVPGQVSALGFIEMVTGWNWDNTFWPLILPSIAAPTVFFFMKQYMDSALPLAIVEAARIDGSSEFGTFNRIVIHIMKPAIAVQAIFSFVGSWNNYFTPALLLNKKDMKTLPILIAQLRSADWLKFDMGQVYMMICLSILPVIVVYLCLSKFIIAGVAVGGVKE